MWFRHFAILSSIAGGMVHRPMQSAVILLSSLLVLNLPAVLTRVEQTDIASISKLPALGNIEGRLQAAPAEAEFPPELIDFAPYAKNPILTASGTGHWDVKIRERGWILREGETYHLWYTGYDGTRESVKQLGYATSADGLHWMPHPENPLCRDHWVEDMMVVKHDGTYYMFAEGKDDQAQLFTSKDRVNWTRVGTLDIRYTDGKPLSAGPFGTPTAWYEDGKWYLFYERRDAGIWLATSTDLKVWTNVQDKPVMVPGPEPFDKLMIAVNQIVKYKGRYYAYFHGSGTETPPRIWACGIAVSDDLIHWKKSPKAFALGENKSSGMLVDDGKDFRFYTMHDRVDVYFPHAK